MKGNNFKYYFIIIGLSLAAILGCGRQLNLINVDTNDNEVKVIDLTSALEDEKNIFFDDLIDSIKIIPLETIDQSLMSEIWSMHVSSQNIFVQDFSTGILIFNNQGKFVKKLDKGPGPEEIAGPRSISYDETTKSLFVYDAMGYKIMKYNSNGEFLSYQSLDRLMAIRDIAVSDTLMLIAEHIQGVNFVVSIGDTVGNIDKTFLFGSDPYPFLFRKFIMPYDSGFNIKKVLDNNIYYFKDNTTKVKYMIRYPMANVDYSKYARMSELERDIPEKEYLFEGEYLETQDYLYLHLNTNNYKVRELVYNKKTAKSFCLALKPQSLTSFVQIETASCYTRANWLVGVIRPENFVYQDIPEEYRWDGSNLNNKISDEDMAKLKAVKPDDNPIVVLFKLKDNI